jgi:hypothetical protein
VNGLLNAFLLTADWYVQPCGRTGASAEPSRSQSFSIRGRLWKTLPAVIEHCHTAGTTLCSPQVVSRGILREGGTR